MSKTQEKRRGAVIVTRVSTNEQVKHGTSLDSQRDMCRAKAAALNLPIVAEYEDAGLSGAYLLMRPGMMTAINDIQTGRADTLICANLSRYSRDVEHQQQIKKSVQNAGGRLVFCDIHFDDTPEGDLIFNTMGNLADYERKNIRARTMRGKTRRAEDGRQPARTTPPFGFHIVTHADILRGEYCAEQLGHYFIVEERAKIVREIFTRYASGMESLHDICRDFNQRGLPPPGRGRCWHLSTLSNILSNSAYKGKAIYGKDVVRRNEARCQEINPRTGQPMTCPDVRRLADPEHWIHISCPCIVTETVWEAAQYVRNAHPSRSGNPRQARMLSGRIFCAVCGGRMTLVSTPNRAYKKQGIYYCTSHRRQSKIQEEGRPHPCKSRGHKRPHVERAVIYALQEATTHPEVVHQALAVYREQHSRETNTVQADQEADDLSRALNEIQVEEARVVQAQIAGMAAGASPDAYAGAFTQIAARRKALRERQAMLKRALQPQKVPVSVIDTGTLVEQIIADVERVLSSPEVADDEKRKLVGRVVEQVRCRGTEGPYEGGIDVVFAPGLFGETADSEEDVLIVHPVTIERRVSQPSAMTKMTWGMTKARNAHVSQKCQTRA